MLALLSLHIQPPQPTTTTALSALLTLTLPTDLRLSLPHAHTHTDVAHPRYTPTLLRMQLLLMPHLRHLYLVTPHALARDGGRLGFAWVDAD